MRILFQMPFSGHLRVYGSTIRLLAERGHRVLLCYDSPDKRRDPSADVLEAHEGIELVSSLPRARRRNERAIAQLRLAIDYIQYLDRRFAGSPYLRRRLEKYLHGPLRLLARAPYGLPLARTGLRSLLAAEKLVPSDARVEQAIASLAPEVVVVTPLIGRSSKNRRQTDTVKAAHSLGIPVAAGIPTWDHLTTKGVMKAVPDRVFVWNELQRRDAAEFHFVPIERVVVTGAQLFDDWFERRPSTTREEFYRRVGLGTASRYVVYVGSSPNISPPELEIPLVRRWIKALRASGDPLLVGLGVLVRPHPYNVETWAAIDLGDREAAVAPRRKPELPMNEQEEALYYDTIHYSEAVVGINTTAMIEAFIQRKPVLTVRATEFRETQEATLHFGNLRAAAGGALQSAATLEEHVVQLRSMLAHPDGHAEDIEAFLRTFVRPCGLDRPATAVLADAIEQLAVLQLSPARSSERSSVPHHLAAGS
jgi:hypothetical protein